MVIIFFFVITLFFYAILTLLGMFIAKEKNNRRLLIKLAVIPLTVSIILAFISQLDYSYIPLLILLSCTNYILIITKN